ERLHRRGLGPEPLPAARLTASRLASRLGELVGRPDFAARAATVGAAVRSEDGVAEAVRVLEQVVR
ncbi:hypothetical protein, partial [Desertihabitans aurantiacus]|uniref:hypothetical protein n=1 Tax=Desertihabitans aurantiacus TaxID=2282477 RepID=UPI0018E560D5